MVLLILAVIWAAVLVPPMLRARAEGSPVDSIGDFRRQLSVLQRTTPAAASGHQIAPYSPPPGATPVVPVRPPMTKLQAQQRRRQVFLVLGTAVPVSFAGAVFSGGAAWGVHLAVLALFGTYVGLLIRARNLAAEREMKVRFLPGTSSQPAQGAMPAELVLRQSAN